jgi:Mrr N-terminal domain/Protein of unknown function DUF262
MAVPDFQSLMLPLLKLAGDGLQHTSAEAVERLAQEFQLSDDDRKELLPSGKQPRFNNRVGWTTTYLKKAGLLRAVGPGRFELTDRGRDVLASPPASIDVSFLESRFPEMSEFRKAGSRGEVAGEEPPATFNTANGTWNQRAGVEERVRETLELSIPNEAIRREALHFLAFAIENADEERGDAWYVRETEHGLRLMTGRLLACEIARSKMRVSVIGPVDDAVRGALGADIENDWEFKKVLGGLLLTFPVEHAAEAIDLLKNGLNSFIDVAMARVRSSVGLEDHVPEAVAHIASVVGRELPQPEPVPQTEDFEEFDDNSDDDDAGASREPRVRGRAPIFEHGQRSIASLMSDIEREVIALPDLQRPFVWEDTKVRELFDSLFVGFPVGTLVFWHTSNDKDARALGAERPGLQATTLVIDGQQRLTSLYAVMRGVEVVGKDGAKRKITIAFRPRDGRFEVADAAIRNDPEFLPNVTELWDGRRLTSQIRRDLINDLRDKGRAVDDKYEDAVDNNLGRAHAIGDYRFPTVDIRKTATTQDEEATEEDVAEIFVRINNQGTRLGQADFVLMPASAPRSGRATRRDTQRVAVAAFASALARSGRTSVDTFLEHRSEFLDVGKAAIACALIPCERENALFDRSRPSPSWYDYLFARMNARLQEFEYNQLSVITFNYDRSLEHYLITALMNSYSLTVERAADLVNRYVPILHAHGTLAPHSALDSNGRAYAPDLGSDAIRKAAASIRVVHEPDSDSVFQVAVERLSLAKRILFLGFGYDPTNMARLRVRAIPQSASIYGTRRGVHHAECAAVREAFQNRIELDSQDREIQDFLRDTVALDAKNSA